MHMRLRGLFAIHLPQYDTLYTLALISFMKLAPKQCGKKLLFLAAAAFYFPKNVILLLPNSFMKAMEMINGSNQEKILYTVKSAGS